MASKVILKKQNSMEVSGHLAIQHFQYNRKKVISLKQKMTVDEFTLYFNPDKNRFERTTLIDYKKYNKLIKENINDLKWLGVVDTTDTTSFIEYFKMEIDLQTNLSTISVRKSVLKKVEEYKTIKKLKDIPFNIIDHKFILGLKNHIRVSNVGTTTRSYMNVIKAILNKAKLEGKYFEKFNYFKGLKYGIIEKSNSALSKNELHQLLNIETDPNICELRMFLIGVFMHGLRASDLFLLRNENFKKDKIEYYSKKNDKKMTVAYDDTLVTLLCNVTGIASAHESNSLNVAIDLIIDDVVAQKEKNVKYGATKRFIDHVTSLPKKNFFFKVFMSKEPSLDKYDKNFEMTKLQYNAHIRLVVHYGYILSKIAQRYQIDKMTSHTSRYTFANLALDGPNPDVPTISKALGHSNLQTTIDYFNKNFGKDRVENLAKEFNSEFFL
jgi:integrase